MAKIRLKFGLTAKTFLAIFTACLLVLAVNGIASRVAFQTGFRTTSMTRATCACSG